MMGCLCDCWPMPWTEEEWSEREIGSRCLAVLMNCAESELLRRQEDNRDYRKRRAG